MYSLLSDAVLDLSQKDSSSGAQFGAKKRLNTDGVVVKEISSKSAVLPPTAVTSQAAARKTAVSRSLLTSSSKPVAKDAAIHHDSSSKALNAIPKDSLEEIFKHMDLAGQMCDEIMGLSDLDEAGDSQVDTPFVVLLCVFVETRNLIVMYALLRVKQSQTTCGCIAGGFAADHRRRQ